MMSKLIIALCMVNLALSGYTSGWGDSQKRLASLSEERWSVPGSAQANARVLLGKGGGGKGDKGGKDKDKGNKDKDNGWDKGGKDKGDKDKGGKDKDGKDKGWGKGGKKSEDKKKRKKKGCDDDNTAEPFWSTEWETTDESLEPTAEPTAEPTINEQFRDTTTSTTTTAIPTTDPTTEPSTDPTTSPSTEPSQEPTSAPTDDPTKGPTEEPTPAPTDEPTQEPTTPAPTDEPTQEPTTPAPITEATVSAPPTVMPTCPNPEQVERDDYPCECYDLLDCDPSRCFEDQERCVTNPQLVAVLEEQADLSSAQAVAVQENAAASETDHGLLIAALLVGVVITAIAFGIGLYFLRRRNRKYGDVASAVSTEVDTAGMMKGASDDMVWETNVIALDALDEEAILPEGGGVRV